MRERFDAEDVKLLEELFTLSGILFDPSSPEEVDSALADVTSQTITLLQQAVEDLASTVEEVRVTWYREWRVNSLVYILQYEFCCAGFMPLQLKRENKALKNELAAAKRSDAQSEAAEDTSNVLHKPSGIISSVVSRVRSLSSIKLLK